MNSKDVMLIDVNIQLPLPRLEILESFDANCDLICQVVGVVVVVVFVVVADFF